ncbi:Hcp family type VI secretion system effector [Enterobacter asburiae]|jgi:type VI secretion system secreted protein Hcp|uniref:Hcp1 family type VI secretion system effector n=1 Tax=Enterobacter asburiae TaxID=61645 RepID=A0AB36FNQ0_ENTAS|nr:type VI secretion system tube protein TssD [Enterobacter asburiae]MBS7119195.1 type VI secretion system tube protein Hcp [Enterobacter cloacae]EKW1580017.1 type VI secretion system tube protein Hcp [Enterobacter asburiae]EKW1582503.1 type VI secretion system tube protein Hcp [Enterobacter asburiae]ELW9466969.1 type VI secretion system tube protein Hcp [Enterobacter asburiae]KJP15572.1 Hcp1 family type VI secretion system effector [Enterobacter asburiae]
MSNPAYLWLTDASGSPVVGGSMVSGRLGAIELKAVAHHLTIPVSGNTGRLTGTRVHTPIAVQKEFDKTTPILIKALCENQTLKSATIKMYQIDDAGIEREYFNIILENVKITGITPNLFPGSGTGTHTETIELRYEAITWKHCDGNIVYRDAWNHMAIA